MLKNVIVLFGGVSDENEISVITGVTAVNALKGAGLDVTPVYISQKGEFFCGGELGDIACFAGDGYAKSARCIIAQGGVLVLKKNKIKKRIPAQCLLNCCHGGLGEGGGVNGLCAAAGIPLAGEGIFPSAAFMDKRYTKMLLKGLGVDILPYQYLTSPAIPAGVEYPVIVKPASLGSSIGVQIARDDVELKLALECAFTYDGGAIIERYVQNRREINCAVCRYAGGVHVSPCEEAVTDGEILSYGDKYEGGGRSVFPAQIAENTAQKIRGITGEVYARLGMRGIARFDYILEGETVYLSEVNTVPGSLAAYMIAPKKESFAGVLTAIMEQAVEDDISGRKKLLQTGILKNLPPRSAKSAKRG